MTDVPRRKWLQVHLSTAVVLMFAAGGIIWGNVREVWEVYHRVYGWPMKAMRATYFGDLRVEDLTFDENWTAIREWQASSIFLDALAALAILFAVWFVCEWWIRWRAGRKKG